MADSEDRNSMLRSLGATQDHLLDAQQLIATHGRGAGQHLVDQIQAALRASESERAAHFDRVLKIIQLGGEILGDGISR